MAQFGYQVAEFGSCEGGDVSYVSLEAARLLEQPVYAPPVALGSRIMVTTRDQAVMVIDKDEASLWYAPVPSNYPAVTYLSPLVLDRRLVIAAGIDGTLAACEAQTGELVWQHNGQGLPLARCSVVIESMLYVITVN